MRRGFDRQIDHLVEVLPNAVRHVAQVAAALFRSRRGQDERAVARSQLPVVGRRPDGSHAAVRSGGHVRGEDVAKLAPRARRSCNNTTLESKQDSLVWLWSSLGKPIQLFSVYKSLLEKNSDIYIYIYSHCQKLLIATDRSGRGG